MRFCYLYRYMTNSEVESHLANLENDYPKLATVFLNEADWSSVVPALLLSDEDLHKYDPPLDKTKVALFGGLYGNQPIGREMLLRLARHLGEGHKRSDSRILNLFRQCDVYILPMVDLAGFTDGNEGKCDYESIEEMESEAGSKFFNGRASPREVTAVRTFIANHDFDAALSIESNGIFIRLPPDDEKASNSAHRQEGLSVLGNTYLRAHPIMGNLSVHAPCLEAAKASGAEEPPEGLTPGVLMEGYAGTLLDYVYLKKKRPIVAAHITCCNFPRGYELPHIWRDNMEALMATVEVSAQGVYGQVMDVKGKVLPRANVTLDGKKSVDLVGDSGKFSLILPAGRHELDIRLEGFEAKRVVFDVKKKEKARKNIVLDRKFGEGATFRKPEDVPGYLDKLTSKHSELCRSYLLSRSPQGREVRVLEISSNLEKSHLKPAIKVLAGVDGRQLVGTQVTLALAEYLLSHSEYDDGIKQLVDKFSLHLIPLLDPDAAAGVTPGTCKLDNRTSGLDLEFGLPAPTRPEVQGQIQLMEERPFILSVNLRGGDEDVTMPRGAADGNDK